MGLTDKLIYSMFIYQKTVDRSTLRQGFQIPVEYHALLAAMPGGMLSQGETRNIKVWIDNVEYDAQLKNQGFDRNKYGDRADVIQVRYGENSPISKKLRSEFRSTWEYVETSKALPENINRKVTIKVPSDIQEYLVFNASAVSGIFIVDCLTREYQMSSKDALLKCEELDFETFEPIEDKSAGILEVSRIQKIRQLDRMIGDSLKRLYGYCCQMTGERIGERYDAIVVEAHHIVTFTQSMNNDSSNLIIISPSYHRIIHAAKPEWNPINLSFKYPNGVVDRVVLNKHLKPQL